MAYLSSTPADRRTMLEVIGVESIEQLFESVPASCRLQQPLELPAAMGEMELAAHIARLASANRAAGQEVCFMGAGSYDHFIPALVDSIASRSEFATCYTPYQPEASQGTLQAMFEYQTLVAELTGMDVSNASLYEGASAAAEAVLMSLAVDRRRRRVVTCESVHPEYRQVLGTYLINMDVELVTLPAAEGTLGTTRLADVVDENTACVLLQHPNFFGCLEQPDEVARIAHRAGALFVVIVDPISLGLLKRPGDYGADIVVAEGQSLGNPMQFGGPYLGMMACREKFLRRMPGRLVGQTTDRNGHRCWVLTLQTREQHIRREKATSNICTNQGLVALRAAVYLAAVGPQGLHEVAELCARKAHYARRQLVERAQFQPVFERPVFKEFTVRCPQGRLAERIEKAEAEGYFAGVPLGRWYPQFDDCLLVAVTEKRTREQIDRLAELLQ